MPIPYLSSRWILNEPTGKESEAMKTYNIVVTAALICCVQAFLCLGCSRSGNGAGNILAPPEMEIRRQAMDFDPSDTIFGDESTHGSDVDIASVVWGATSAAAGAGDIVVFDDETSWDVAV